MSPGQVGTAAWRHTGLRMAACALVLCVCAAARPSVLLAQCPDGTPPPCRGGTSAGGITRRANPPLDERTWIVVPFENVTRAQDIEWLREASVNLLYLDMSKWRDIRVIDDERVADLVRETPETRGGQAMSLQAGMAVARRAGAGQLVMGDLLKVGSRTRVVAKVFDVRSGQRVRNVIEETGNADSLMGIFGRLARGILNAEPPTEAALGVGTTSLAAYQEYLAGVQALNAFDTPEARRRFEAALQIDTTFALAHYKLSIVIGWSNAGDPSHRRHAEAAARLAGALPARERTLIAAQAQAAGGDYGRSCETLFPLVRADSSDIEALYNVGECSFHDAGVVPLATDTSRFRFRGDWNVAIHSFQRVLQLDPTYHLAFQHIQDALQTATRGGCLLVNGQPACNAPETAFQAAVRRSGDSLLIEPVHAVGEGSRAYAAQLTAAAHEGSHHRNLEEARRAAADWLAVGPTESRAQIAYARALLRLGRIEEARAAAAQVSQLGTTRPEIAAFAIDRVEIALKSGDTREANRLYDSLFAVLDTVGGAQIGVSILGGVLGRAQRLDTAIVGAMTAPDWVKSYFRAQARVLLGLRDDSLIPLERAFISGLSSIPGAGGRAANLVTGSVAYSMLGRGADQVPVTDTANPDFRVRLYSALGDTARFRAALLALDAAIDAAREDGDHGLAIVSAEAHLVLHDTAGALARLRVFRDVTWRVTPLVEQVAPGFGQTGMLWPRTFLLLGDLAAATGARAEAALAYRRFIGMWDGGDAETQPMVQRARTALASLGP
jgi:eukaryotic-like serine/threonine-protein kinase